MSAYGDSTVKLPSKKSSLHLFFFFYLLIHQTLYGNVSSRFVTNFLSGNLAVQSLSVYDLSVSGYGRFHFWDYHKHFYNRNLFVFFFVLPCLATIALSINGNQVFFRWCDAPDNQGKSPSIQQYYRPNYSSSTLRRIKPKQGHIKKGRRNLNERRSIWIPCGTQIATILSRGGAIFYSGSQKLWRRGESKKKKKNTYPTIRL